MYLKNGREIIESDRYPGYFIDQSNGAWCDSEGNYVGGNADDGDKPGGSVEKTVPREPSIVFISKTGKQYYPTPNKTALTPIMLTDAIRRDLKPSAGYNKYMAKLYKDYFKQTNKSHK